jgi:hypothetical protein
MKNFNVIFITVFVLCLLTSKRNQVLIKLMTLVDIKIPGLSHTQEYDPCQGFTCPANAECRVYDYNAACTCQEGYVMTIDGGCDVGE